MLDPVYKNLRKEARRIVDGFPPPDFYEDHAGALRRSVEIFQTDPVIAALADFVSERLENDFGHGMKHCTKVSKEAGALVIIECSIGGREGAFTRRKVLVAQTAGLLHDIHRKRKDHAARGAEFAREVLRRYPFTPAEAEEVSTAIYNHEAFGKTMKPPATGETLISDCLYDSDKFRWGPDNFTDTVWDMLAYLNPPIVEFVKRFPEGMRGISRIRDTFRSATGKKYGPQFIDIGMAIGEQLYAYLQGEFAELF